MRRPDQARAYWHIREATRKGIIQPAREFACVDCGGPATDYDHFLGYELTHIFDIQPVCRTCHRKRGFQRGELKPRRRVVPKRKRIYNLRPITPERREMFKLASRRYRLKKRLLREQVSLNPQVLCPSPDNTQPLKNKEAVVDDLFPQAS